MTSALRERTHLNPPLHALESGWRRNVLRPPIEMPCMCGGPEIQATSLSIDDVREAVQRHQIEPVHIAYDEAHDIPLASWQIVAKGAG
jgi:hypothetical protein